MYIDMASAHIGLNEAEVVVITTSAQKEPHSSIGSGCIPGASRVVLYKFGQIDTVCTLVQAT